MKTAVNFNGRIWSLVNDVYWTGKQCLLCCVTGILKAVSPCECSCVQADWLSSPQRKPSWATLKLSWEGKVSLASTTQLEDNFNIREIHFFNLNFKKKKNLYTEKKPPREDHNYERLEITKVHTLNCLINLLFSDQKCAPVFSGAAFNVSSPCVTADTRRQQHTFNSVLFPFWSYWKLENVSTSHFPAPRLDKQGEGGICVHFKAEWGN